MLLDGWSNFCPKFVGNDQILLISNCIQNFEFITKNDLFVIFQVSILSKKNRSLGSFHDIEIFAVLSPSQILKFNFHTQNIFG